MDAYREPLTRVAEAMQWFLVADEIRLLHVVTSESLRLAVLEQVAIAEHSSLNTRPFAVLEAPVEEQDDGWTLRATELRDDWTTLRETVAKLDPPITLDELPPERNADGLVAFGAELAWMLGHLGERFAGLTVILAPVWVRDPSAWVTTLRSLLAQRDLRTARFVVVDCDGDHVASLAEEYRELAERVDARVDEAAARAGISQMIDNISSAPPGAGAARLAGLAGPMVPPPRRWNAPPDLEPEDLSREYFDAELPSGFADQTRVQELKVLVLRAAQAAQCGDTTVAIGIQRAARDLATDLGLERESIVLEMALGSYHLQAGDPASAEQAYVRSRTVGLDRMFTDLAAQAQLALAAAQLIGKRPIEAAMSYAWAGQLSAQTGQTALAIEGYRLAGQIYAGEGRVDDAGNAWRQALAIAEAASPDDRKASSAIEVAESLAALCRTQGLEHQASAFDAQAALFRAEAEAPPVAEELH